MYLVWAQHSDRSNEPEFLILFSNENRAKELCAIINKTAPMMNVQISKVWNEDEK